MNSSLFTTTLRKVSNISAPRRVTRIAKTGMPLASVSARAFTSTSTVARPLISRQVSPFLNKYLNINKKYYSTEHTSIADKIAAQVKASPVVVYMKGTPVSPQCGFSRAVVEVLRRENLARYDYYNILEDEVLRQGIKDYSNWPTIPQVYIGGEFVGGCDIIMDMHGEGTLAEALQKAGAEIQEH